MASLASLVTSVRDLCGDPDTTELPDGKIQSILNKRA